MSDPLIATLGTGVLAATLAIEPSLAYVLYVIHRPRVLVDSTAGALGLVERLLILRGQLSFARASIQALSTLAQATEEMHLPSRTSIARAGDEADGLFMILDGIAKFHRVNGPDILGSGSAIGGLETLGELPFATDVEAISALRVLRLPRARRSTT